jgi:hypothetical protein
VGLDLLEVALDDGASQRADLVHLGDVDGLGGVVTLVIEPVLVLLLASFVARLVVFWPKLTSVAMSFSRIFSFSSSLARSAYWSSSLLRMS